MKRSLQRSVVLCALGAVALAGCAGFRQGKVSVTSWPLTATRKPSIGLTVTLENSLNGKPIDAGAATLLEKASVQIQELYYESGLFSEVRRTTEDTDLVAIIRIKRSEDGSLAMAFLTGLTLYVLPSSADITWNVRTEFRDRDGKTLGTIEKTEVVTLWQQLFLFPVMFVKFPIPVIWGAFDDVHRATLVQAKAEGIV